MATRYHAGELAVQERAGVREQADRMARGVFEGVPAPAARFLAERSMLVVGARDGEGRVWCSMLAGDPGFLRVADERTLTVGAVPRPGDPLAPTLAGPAQVGTLAIEPATRRRMRLNGTARPAAGGLRIETAQVFANCPRFITRREMPRFTAPPPGTGAEPMAGAGLDERQAAFVRAADTFFIATRGGDGGADASHRGGDPGFVEVVDGRRLRWPDYPGNAMFATLGNLHGDPAAGLLFPDWATGSLLLLTGSARVAWDDAGGRAVEFTADAVAELPGADRPRS
ncbi:pyridoxamine 5'-phosphate oxidase family protein [Streptomyces sp. SL13]|uniref:Pyridoxamine 5'-phosphate oxidase family protein n=1 Tax=Streptantibioticus silvisoli TaxID=2705255 RepID=A0AA90HDB8_9ACTN|nr:pyridoxamine 5'-phosphate oxidase family protein [Streptantibioticus silvisoli]MDI5963815.1 pyridoxamine 5'-phosphate oxidase family protein [Streptantibioticus silvisoli]MDI5972802.1 pyridoxamine 5'-phosphate oxidase family protein [Streptantibioticus silvisoli]